MRPIAKVVVWLLCAMLALTGLPIPNHAYICQGDGSYLGSWTDSTPLTTGNYLSLRTTTNNVLFDEVMVGKVKKYYYQGGARACPEPCRRVAMRDGTSVYYLFGDHLGSTNVTTDNGSALVARLLYKPFGQVRYNTNNQKTDYRYTGQWWASGGGATLGLYDYGARWYDPSLARFIQADTIVPAPGNPQSLNRYSYVLAPNPGQASLN